MSYVHVYENNIKTKVPLPHQTHYGSLRMKKVQQVQSRVNVVDEVVLQYEATTESVQRGLSE